MAVTVGWRGIGVALDGDADLLAAVLGQLPAFFGPVPQAVHATELVRAGGTAVLDLPDGLGCTGPDGPETHRAMASRLELLVAERLPDVVAVHAGVVAVDRRAVVLPGRSMAGKSTLVRALLERGATYLSDEYALVDASGLVHAYPRPMTLRTPEGSERELPLRRAAFDDPPVPVALVAALRHDAAGWEVEPLSPGQVVMALVDNCVGVRREPVRALTALTALAQAATGLIGTRGEAALAAERLLSALRPGPPAR